VAKPSKVNKMRILHFIISDYLHDMIKAETVFPVFSS